MGKKESYTLGEIFAIHIFEKGYVSNIYKALLQFTNNNNLILKGKI